MTILLLVLFFQAIIGLALYVLVVNHDITDEEAKSVMDDEGRKLTKTLPLCIGICAHILTDFACGDLIAKNDTSEKYDQLGRDISKKNGDSFKFWLKICYAIFLLSHTMGWLYLTLIEIKSRRRIYH